MILNGQFRKRVVDFYTYVEFNVAQSRNGSLIPNFILHMGQSAEHHLGAIASKIDMNTFKAKQAKEWHALASNLPNAMINQAFVSVFTSFEGYLVNVFEEILGKHPELLSKTCDKKHTAILGKIPNNLEDPVFTEIYSQTVEDYSKDSYDKKFIKLNRLGLSVDKVFAFNSLPNIVAQHPKARETFEILRRKRNNIVHSNETAISSIEELNTATEFLGDVASSISCQALKDLGIENEDNALFGS